MKSGLTSEAFWPFGLNDKSFKPRYTACCNLVVIPPPVGASSLVSLKKHDPFQWKFQNHAFLYLRGGSVVYSPAEGSLVFRKEMNMKVSTLWRGFSFFFSLFSMETLLLLLFFPFSPNFSLQNSGFSMHKLK